MTQPPTSLLLAYRLLGIRLPREYDAWVAHDVTTRTYVWFRTLRTVLWGVVAIGLYAIAYRSAFQWPKRARLIQLGFVVVAYSLLWSGKSLVQRQLRWQRINRHGRPVKPRSTAILENAEAAIAVALAAIVLTGGSAAYAYHTRPAIASCAKPHADLLERIHAGLTKDGAEFVVAREASFSGGKVIAATMRATSTDPKRKEDRSFEVWLVLDSGIYSYTETHWSSFGKPPVLDRIAGEAVRVAVDCVVAVTKR